MLNLFSNRKAIKEDLEQQKIFAMQQRIGDEIFEALKQAGSENTVYNLFTDGSKCEELEPIQTSVILNRDNNYIISVKIPKQSKPSSRYVGLGDYSILHVSIKLSRIERELACLCSDYNPEQLFSILDLESFKKNMVDYVSSFRLFN